MNAALTNQLVAAVFTEWDRRYREEPERFQSEAARLLKETPQSYGEAAAPYFLQIARELGTELLTAPESPISPPNLIEQ